jgi:hypothetical protein
VRRRERGTNDPDCPENICKQLLQVVAVFAKNSKILDEIDETSENEPE